MLDPFQLPFMQRAALEIVLLAPIAGILGAQIVLRSLAFFTHAAGASAFPGLVVATPLGLPPQLLALGVGGTFSALIHRLDRGGSVARDATIALLLVTALAAGIVLASDVFESGGSVDQLLFGSVLAIGTGELIVTGAALVGIAAVALRFRRRWIAEGFDGEAEAGRPRAGGGLPTVALLACLAVGSIVALDAVGSLLVSALLVVPAAIVRPHARSVVSLELGAAAVAMVLGLSALLASYHLDVPPGATTATIGAVAFVVSLGIRPLLAGVRRTPVEAVGHE